jgi:ubiquitin-protein ligase E3 C
VEEQDLDLTLKRFSKRQMAQISPRLGVLNNIPFAISFDDRVGILRRFIDSDRGRLRRDYQFDSPHGATIIRRNHIAKDGFDRLQDLDLKRTVRIVFVDRFDNPE